MAAERCYYETLCVERSASTEEIKRSYRRLAMKLHPDRKPGDTQAESEFKACAEAYEVLSDTERRARYDQFGRAGLRGTPGHDFHHMGSEDIFSMFSDIFGGAMGGGGQRRARRGPTRGLDLELQIEITLEDVLRGVEREVTFQRLDTCNTCKGIGAKPGTEPISCPTCQGHGQVRQSGLGGMFQMVTTCPNCGGRGRIVVEKCSDCRGNGRVGKRRTVTVKVPPGISEGQIIRIAGEGEPAQAQPGQPAGAPGDLHIGIVVAEHEDFQRDGDDLVTGREITFAQAALGASVRIGTLDGEAQLDIPAGTTHGTLLRIPGRGLPHLRSGRRGELVVATGIRVPKKLNERQRELLRELAQIDGVETAESPAGVWTKIKGKFKG